LRRDVFDARGGRSSRGPPGPGVGAFPGFHAAPPFVDAEACASATVPVKSETTITDGTSRCAMVHRTRHPAAQLFERADDNPLMKTLLTALVLALLCTMPRVARAENKEVARQAYDERRRRYDLNEFGPALEAFKRAYLNYEDPAFLFNIAQCQRQLGKKEEAIRFYRSYLRNKPDAPNRDEIKATVAKLEAEVADDKARVAEALRNAPHPSVTVAAPVVSTPTAANALTAAPSAKRQPVYKKWWLWTIVGVAAAGAATGVALAVTSQRTEGSLMPVTVTR
jgi:hypothetical protein